LKWVLFIGVLLFIVLAIYLIIRESRPGGVIKKKTVGGPTQPTHPSLLVKPFQNDTTTEMTAILALGISDDVRRRLIREPGLLLVSCPAPLGRQPESLKPGPVPAHHQVADYILHGTVHPNDSMPRLTVALIDGVSGKQLWQHRYTISHSKLYAIREDITRQVLGALGISLNPTSSGDGTSMVPSEKAWRLTVRGKYPTPKGADVKRGWRLDKFEQAVASDSSYAEAWRMLSLSHFQTALSAVNADQQMDMAMSCAETAIALNRQSSGALALRAAALLWRRQYAYADGVAASAVAEGPSDLFAHLTMARNHYALGRYEAAVASSRKAQLLSPCNLVPALLVSARAHRMQGALTEAINLYTQIIQRERNQDTWRWQVHLDLAELYRGSNDLHAAQAQLMLAMNLNRDLSVEQLRKIYWYDNPQQLRKRRANLRHTGLPETTPPKLRLESSIVILPFISDTPDETDAWFLDGLGDYLTELLSRSQSMMVIAYNAGKALHNTLLKREALALQLGADYLISPHVRYGADDQVVIEVTLRNPSLAMTLWKASFQARANKYRICSKRSFEKRSTRSRFGLCANFATGPIAVLRRIPPPLPAFSKAAIN
jgi:TolB-like protein